MVAEVKWSDNTKFPPKTSMLAADQLPGLSASANAKFSKAAISVVTQSVYFSTKGDDTNGLGTPSFPVATLTKATALAKTYSPTITSQVDLIGDPGSYSMSVPKICPNINWNFSNVTILDTSPSTHVILDSTWEGTTQATASFSAKGVRIGSTTTLNIDTAGFTTIGGNITLEKSLVDREYTFINRLAAHNITLTNDNSKLATAPSGDPIIDSVSCILKNGFSMCAGSNTLQINGEARDTTIKGISNAYTGNGGAIGEAWNVTMGNTYVIEVDLFQGNPIAMSIDTTAGGTGTIDLNFDNTTYSPVSITGTSHYNIINNSLKNVYTAQTLADAATTIFNVDLGPNAEWQPGASRTLASPTGSNVYIGQTLTLDINPTVNNAVITFNAIYVTPNGTPIPQPSQVSGVSTLYNFIYNSLGNWELMACSTPLVVDVTGTSATLQHGVTYYADNASLVTLTFPTPLFKGFKTKVVGINAGGWKVAQLSGQTGHWDTGAVVGYNVTTTGVGGFMASSDPYDSIDFTGISTTDYAVSASKGNISVN